MHFQGVQNSPMPMFLPLGDPKASCLVVIYQGLDFKMYLIIPSQMDNQEDRCHITNVYGAFPSYPVSMVHFQGAQISSNT